MELAGETELLPSAFEMVLKHNIAVYDALCVELARRRGLPLVTCDEHRAKVARDEGVEVILLRGGLPIFSFRGKLGT